MTNRSYLILHGWQGSGPDHWQTWLADRLRAAGETVDYPLLPAPDAPRLDDWIQALRQHVGQMRGERIVVCHSLAVVAWFHSVGRPLAPPVDRLLLVAPPCPAAMVSIPELAEFNPVPLDAEALARSATQCLMVCSTADDYCPAGAAAVYATPLNVEVDVLPPAAGHINVASGFGPWPQVERWCYRSETRFTDGA